MAFVDIKNSLETKLWNLTCVHDNRMSGMVVWSQVDKNINGKNCSETTSGPVNLEPAFYQKM